MRAGLPAAQYRLRRTFRLAGRAEIAAIETIENAIGGEEGEPAIVACDDSGGAVVNFDDVGFGHGCSFADNVGAPVECMISGFATGGSATGAGRRRDAAIAHIAHGWLWIQSHAVTPNTVHQISGGSPNRSMKWVSNLFTATSVLFSTSAAKRTDPSCASCKREVAARTPLQARPWHSRAWRPASASAFRALRWINSAHRCIARLLPPRPKSS